MTREEKVKLLQNLRYSLAVDADHLLTIIEAKTERCKWIRYDYRTICPQSHDIDNPYWRIPEKRMDVLKYCPYCGKEIEVIKQ